MRQIIDGILYDADAAELIDSIEYIGRSIDGMHWKQRDTLYRGQNGRYFMVESVLRPPSPLLRLWHGWWNDWDEIRPLTAEKADVWLSKREQERKPPVPA